MDEIQLTRKISCQAKISFVFELLVSCFKSNTKQKGGNELKIKHHCFNSHTAGVMWFVITITYNKEYFLCFIVFKSTSFPHLCVAIGVKQYFNIGL